MDNGPFSTLISGYSFLESPRWHDGRLWLSDFYTKQVIAVDMDGSVEQIAQTPGQPSGLGWLPDGRLLVVSMKDRVIMRREADGRLVQHADLSLVCTGHANDMIVDREGYAWVGNFGFDLMGNGLIRAACLARVDPKGVARMVARGLHFPNGMAITPDGKTLIVNETFGNRISAFEIREDRSLGERRDFAAFGDVPKATSLTQALPQAKCGPDGLDLDAEGAVWIADSLNGRMLRVADGGQVLQKIPTGKLNPFGCALGGTKGNTLFVCVAPDFHEHARAGARASAVWTCEVDVPAAERA